MPDQLVHTTTVQRNAIVIGGGLAGIAASLALAKQGVPVTLLEAKRRLGGRAGSFVAERRDGQEETVDYCQHVGMGCCLNLRRLISWLGQDAFWDEHRELHFYGPEGRYQRLAALPFLPAPLHLANWLTGWPGLSWLDRLSVARGMLRIRKISINDPLDDISALEWLTKTRQTRGAIDHFWSTIIVSALGEETSRVSLAAVCKVMQDGFLNHREAFHLLVPKLPLNELFNHQAARALRDLNVDLRLESPVSKITRHEGMFQVTSHEEKIPASAIIIAVPWHQVAQLNIELPLSFSHGLPEVGHGLESSPITGIHTWWDRPWLDTPHAAIVGRLCQWVFPKAESTRDYSEKQNTPSENYYQIVISASRDLPKRKEFDLKELIRADLANAFPKVKDATLLRMKVVTDPNAVFSVTPGTLRFRPENKTSLPGVWLAGDWIRTGWPSTMESAILSGFNAARGVLNESNVTIGRA